MKRSIQLQLRQESEQSLKNFKTVIAHFLLKRLSLLSEACKVFKYAIIMTSKQLKMHIFSQQGALSTKHTSCCNTGLPRRDQEDSW